jgi:hypothetical protein
MIDAETGLTANADEFAALLTPSVATIARYQWFFLRVWQRLPEIKWTQELSVV